MVDCRCVFNLFLLSFFKDVPIGIQKSDLLDVTMAVIHDCSRTIGLTVVK